MRLWTLATAVVAVAVVVGAAGAAAATGLKQVRTVSTETFAPLPAAPQITCSGVVPLKTSSVIVSNGVGSHTGRYLTVNTASSCVVTPEFIFVARYDSTQFNANGDEIFYFGDIHINLATGALTESYQITGGTGIFAGATGSGDVVGTVDLATGAGTNTSVGTISTVGSTK